jgi:hypothetical protein
MFDLVDPAGGETSRLGNLALAFALGGCLPDEPVSAVDQVLALSV